VKLRGATEFVVIVCFTSKRERFATVDAARNEEHVIVGKLI